MAHQVKILSAKPEDLSSIPSDPHRSGEMTYKMCDTTGVNVHTYTYSHTHKFKKKLKPEFVH